MPALSAVEGQSEGPSGGLVKSVLSPRGFREPTAGRSGPK